MTTRRTRRGWRSIPAGAPEVFDVAARAIHDGNPRRWSGAAPFPSRSSPLFPPKSIQEERIGRAPRDASGVGVDGTRQPGPPLGDSAYRIERSGIHCGDRSCGRRCRNLRARTGVSSEFSYDESAPRVLCAFRRRVFRRISGSTRWHPNCLKVGHHLRILRLVSRPPPVTRTPPPGAAGGGPVSGREFGPGRWTRPQGARRKGVRRERHASARHAPTHRPLGRHPAALT